MSPIRSHAFRPLRRLLLSLLLATAGAAVVPAPAHAAYTVGFSGTVVCDWSSDAVQGVWVQNADGSDGWATWWAYPGRTNAARYSITVTSSRPDPAIRLDIGCGRNASGGWRRTLLTPDFRTRSGFTENRRCIGTQAAADRARVCTPAPNPSTLSYNQGASGYCTWGAIQKWRSWVGSYPNIVGNANQMDDDARRKGFYVSSVPHVGSMVVWNDGSTYGHVAWVIAVRKSGSTVLFDSVDMNVGSWVDRSKAITTGFGKYTTRTNLTWNPSVQAFIVAPT